MVSWLGILLCAVASMVFGMLWYAVIFGKIWSKSMGFTEESMKQQYSKGDIARTHLSSLIAALGIAITLNIVLVLIRDGAKDYNFSTNLWYSLLIGAGFGFMTLWRNGLYSGKDQAVAKFLACLHIVIEVMIFGLILSFWILK